MHLKDKFRSANNFKITRFVHVDFREKNNSISSHSFLKKSLERTTASNIDEYDEHDEHRTVTITISFFAQPSFFYPFEISEPVRDY